MPIYEYACESCGHQFEKLVRIGAEAPPCPSCEAADVKKLVSASGFILKGSGWYKDHYGLKKSAGGAEAKSSTSSSEASSSSSSTSSSGGSGGDGGGTKSSSSPAAA